MYNNPKKRLGSYLVADGAITEEQLMIALRIQEVTKERLGDIVVHQNFAPRERVIKAMMRHSPDDMVGSAVTNITLPKDFLITTRTVDKGNTGDVFFIATLNPDPKWVIEKATEILTGLHKRPVEVKMKEASIQEIRTILKGYETDHGKKNESKRIEDEDDPNVILERMLDEALSRRASDIRIENTFEGTTVSYRVDGVIRKNVTIFAKKQTEPLFARIKTLMGVDATNTRIIQDGSFPMVRNGRKVDLRGSTTPCKHGESIALRIQIRDNVKNLYDLGISRINEIMEVVSRPKGIFIICGSTGQGKTTTMYSFLQGIDTLHEQVITAEDPIEYSFPNITQIQVNRQVGLDFKDICRGIMRQDPDRALIGELRDAETLQACNYMSDSGHGVLTSFHAESIANFFPRLDKLGAGEDNIDQFGFSLTGILVQQLVRRLCPDCQVAGQKQRKGCNLCDGTGYYGRIPVIEFVAINGYDQYQKLRKEIMENRPTYYTFQQDARAKVAAGLTDCSELKKHLKIDVCFCGGQDHCIDGGPKCIQ